IAAGTVRPGALRARSEGAHGGGSTARRRAARPVVTLTLVFNPGLARLPCRFDGGPRRSRLAGQKRTVYRGLPQPVRGIAQSGSASGLGPEGRRFKSCCPDNHLAEDRKG